MPTLKVLTFNVNSVRARLHQIEEIVHTLNPDIIGLQETKVQNLDFPQKEIERLGFEVVFHGQKGHYGVATLSRLPMRLIANRFAEEEKDAQCRTLITSHQVHNQTITLFNGYFPQGENRSHETKFPAKRAYYQNLLSFVRKNLGGALILMGDFNVAPEDDDVGVTQPERWLQAGACSFLPEEREWYQSLLSLGLYDTWRTQNPTENQRFSWFDYRTKAFERQPKRGLRIDHILCSSSLLNCLVSTDMDYAIRAMKKPSDHVPVWASFSL